MCVPNKAKDLNLRAFNMITNVSEWNDTPWECKCKFDERKCNSDQWWNNHKYWCECKKAPYIWNRLYMESCYM